MIDCLALPTSTTRKNRFYQYFLFKYVSPQDPSGVLLSELEKETLAIKINTQILNILRRKYLYLRSVFLYTRDVNDVSGLLLCFCSKWLFFVLILHEKTFIYMNIKNSNQKRNIPVVNCQYTLFKTMLKTVILLKKKQFKHRHCYPKKPWKMTSRQRHH